MGKTNNHMISDTNNNSNIVNGIPLVFNKGGSISGSSNSTKISNEWTTLICSFVASFGLFCNGTFVGWSSHVTEFFNTSCDTRFTKKEIVYVTTSLALGAAVSPIMIHKLWQYIGTKICVIFSCIFMIVSWILLTFNTYIWMLLIGRFIGGLAIGALHFLIPVYIYDISTNAQKSTLDCIINTQFVCGIFAQYVINSFTYPFLSCTIAAVAPLIFMFSFLLLPESPRYLCFKGNSNAGKAILQKFKDIDDDCEEDIRIWSREKIKEKNLKTIVHTTFGVNQIIPIFGLIMCEQLIGSISILFFMEKIFKLTHGEYSAEVQSIICCGCFLISIPLMKILGFSLKNKLTLFWTTICMSISLGVLGMDCHYKGTFGKMDEYRQISLLAICAFYVFYAIGPYRLTTIYVNKLIPKSNYFTIRSFLITLIWLTIAGVTRILPYLIDNIGVGWLFWNMASLCLFATIFMTIFVPQLSKYSDESNLLETSTNNDVDVENDNNSIEKV